METPRVSYGPRRRTRGNAVCTFGIEEEFFLVGPETLLPHNVAEAALEALSAVPRWAPYLHPEFLASQLEFASPVFDDTPTAYDTLAAFRADLADTVPRFGAIAASSGTPPHEHAPPDITANPRYLRIARNMATLVAEHQLCGLHVHVGISDREAGVQALNATRGWLPLLAALGANSPILHGKLTHFDSWRTVELRRWPATGCPPAFHDASDYARRVARLPGVGGIIDRGSLMWASRLSEAHHTIEFRVADAQLTVESTIAIAALFRALVHTAIAGKPLGAPRPAPEMLSAALVHAARSGVRGTAYSPVADGMVPIRRALRDLCHAVTQALHEHDDTDRIAEYCARVLCEGNGAVRQRAMFAHRGLPGLSALYRTTLVPNLPAAAPV